MEAVTYYNFCKQIANDYNIDFNKKILDYPNQFPIKNGKRKIKSSYDAIIVDKNNNEYPYMLSQYQRNDDKLIDFKYIYTVRHKQLSEILTEVNLKLKSVPCKLCEGNGWFSKGTRYFYKDIYCEI